MKRTFFSIAILSGILLMSCNSNKNRREVETVDEVDVPATTVTPTPIFSENIAAIVTDNVGNIMELSYNDDMGTATVVLNGEIITMRQDTTASGVRMHNDEYIYEEWQGHILLKKDGKVVFDNRDEVKTFLTNKQGKKLDMDFNNNNNTVTMMYDGSTFTLRGDTTASGLRYSNSNYVYEEWQGHAVLKKNGRVIFDNTK